MTGGANTSIGNSLTTPLKESLKGSIESPIKNRENIPSQFNIQQNYYQEDEIQETHF